LFGNVAKRYEFGGVAASSRSSTPNVQVGDAEKSSPVQRSKQLTDNAIIYNTVGPSEPASSAALQNGSSEAMYVITVEFT
jgi:hypothetical protein